MLLWRLRAGRCSFTYRCCRSEMLHESSSLPLNVRELAALVVSKLYYHLGALDESLAFALRAGTLFDLSQRNEYVNTVVGASLFGILTIIQRYSNN